MTVIAFSEEYVSHVSTIHIEALDGDFLPGLGIDFLEEFYRSGLRNGAIFGSVYLSNKVPVGFITGCEDSGSLFKNIF